MFLARLLRSLYFFYLCIYLEGFLTVFPKDRMNVSQKHSEGERSDTM